MKLLLLMIPMTIFGATELETRLESIREEFKFPGLIGAVVDGNKSPTIVSVGIRKIGFKEKINIEDPVHIGSCAKSMTATLASILIQEKKLKWSSTLKELLPSYKIHKTLENITIEKLLAHRSGLTKNMNDLNRIYADESRSYTQNREIALKKLISIPPEHTVGEYQYSNQGYILVGHILETLSGESFEKLIVKKLFKPLGMKSCGFGATSVESEKNPSSIWGHYEKDKKLIPIHADNPISTSPAGTIHCSVPDWIKYIKIHLKTDSSNLISKVSLLKLHTLYPAPESNYTFGGWIRVEREWAGGYTLSHGGTNTLNYANIWLAPNKEKAFIAFTNTMRNGHKGTDTAVGALIKSSK